jgi:Protein of unknwon function (DUF3310)
MRDVIEVVEKPCQEVPKKVKYNEDLILDEIRDYIESTYGQHYAKDVKYVQTFDAINAMDGDEAWRFYKNSAIKYLWRLGKKQGFNRQDLLKTAHYVVILLSTLKDRK